MNFVDSHCHIHEAEFYSDEEREAVYKRAIDAQTAMICIGTSQRTSVEALEFCKTHENAWPTVGVHPHDAKAGYDKIGNLLEHFSDEIVGIGEIGLDYFYMNSPREVQIAALEQQLQWAVDYKLPVSFHVRDSFDDFWPILSNFPGIKGVLHSFTDNMSNMQRGLENDLYIGVNGISTFTKDKNQQEMFAAIPVKHMLLETDAPFLTPLPHRGKVNEPVFVKHVAEYHAKIRGIAINELAKATSHNATTLFGL